MFNIDGEPLKSHLLSDSPFHFYNSYTRSARPFTSSSTALAMVLLSGAW